MTEGKEAFINWNYSYIAPTLHFKLMLSAVIEFNCIINNESVQVDLLTGELC